MDAMYIARKGRARRQQDQITVERHFPMHIDIFYVAINKQLHDELNSRFSERALELLTLTLVLEHNYKNGYKIFDFDQICALVEKFYPLDFTSQEMVHLRYQLQHFICEAQNDGKVRNMSTLQDVCQYLAETGKLDVYFLFDRLIRLVLTLPVSTTTTERAFSAMKIMKTRLCNKMDDKFLADSLIIYIERKISKSFSLEAIIDDFKSVKDRRVLFDL